MLLFSSLSHWKPNQIYFVIFQPQLLGVLVSRGHVLRDNASPAYKRDA